MRKQLADALDVEALKNDASQVCKFLAKLSGILKVHLAMEDNSLYPRLLSSNDAQTKKVCEQYMNEMGGLKAAVGDYAKNWMAALNVQKDPQGFIKDTKAILDACGSSHLTHLYRAETSKRLTATAPRHLTIYLHTNAVFS